MDDAIRLAAQTTVDAIDKEMARLQTTRESLVRLFDLCVRVPESVVTPENHQPKPIPNGDDRGRTSDMVAHWDELRKAALLELDENNGEMLRKDLRDRVGISPKQCHCVLKHDWFTMTERSIKLTAAGEAEIVRLRVDLDG